MAPHPKHLLMILSMYLAVIALCSFNTLADTTSDVSTESSAKDAVDKLLAKLEEKEKQLGEIKIQLEEKDKALAVNKEENKELSAKLDLEKAGAVQADPATDESKTELAIAHSALQMTLWKSLSSAVLYYYIKVPSGPGGGYDEYLYPDNFNYLCSGDLAASPLQSALFTFTNNLDGTFSIYSIAKEKYLQAETNSFQSATAFTFSTDQSKFVLHYNPQPNKQPGILVDIYSLANGFFLSAGNQPGQNRVVANLNTAPAKKFLIVPVG